MQTPPASVSAVTLTQVLLFCASGLLPEPRTVEPEPTPESVVRYRETPDLLLCPTCENAMDEDRCTICTDGAA